MKINIIQNGKIKDKAVLEIRDEFLKRFSKFGKMKIVEKKPKKNTSLWNDNKSYKILLDEHGKLYSSEEFSKLLYKISMQHGEISFCIGEATGHDQKTIDESDLKISLSPMTLPHQIAHCILVEQIYRAATIKEGRNYHKA